MYLSMLFLLTCRWQVTAESVIVSVDALPTYMPLAGYSGVRDCGRREDFPPRYEDAIGNTPTGLFNLVRVMESEGVR